MEVTIRKATAEDIPSVLKLWTKLMEFHRDLSENFEPADDAENVWESYVRNKLDEQDFFLIVAEVGDKIIGYCSAYIQSNTPVFRIKKYGVIGDLFVEDAFRRRGIGRKIFDFARKWFEQKGVEHLQVSVAQVVYEVNY
jgi:GNAT superfamily N-acetyltransferase